MSNNIEQIKKSLKQKDIKIVSFDIFDTIIIRLTAKAEDVFRIMEYKTGIAGFAKQREQLQSERSIIAEKTQNKPHCNFDEIYEFMCEKADFDLNGHTWEKLKQLELDIEKDVLVQNKPIFEVYKYAKSLGKKVIAVSDMYLGEKEIIPLIEKCGYTDFDKIYVSADVNKTKYRLDLFDYVAENENVSPECILHIGDNYEHDVVNAKKRGFKSALYEGNRKKEILPLYQSISAGVFCSLKNSNENFWYNLGSEIGGPLYCGIINKIKEKINGISPKPNKIFFLSRDGYNLFNIINKMKIIDIECEYFYASRRAMLLCGIDKLDENALSLLPPYTFGQTVDELLEYIADGDIEEKEVKKCGFSGLDDTIKNLDDFVKFKKIISNNDKLFLSKAKEERNLFEKYLNKIQFLTSDSIVFDCGWNGSSQYFLDKALELIGYKGKNYFIYVGLMNSEKCKKQLKGKKFDTLLFGINSNNNICDRISRSIVLLELFFGAPHGSVWKYADNEKGFIEENIESEYDYKNQILKGIIDFVKIAYPLSQKLNIVPSTEDCLENIYRLIENPTAEQAVKIGNIENIDGFAANKNHKSYIAKLTAEDIKLNPNELYWPQGIYVRPDIDEKVKIYVMEKTGVKMNNEKVSENNVSKDNISENKNSENKNSFRSLLSSSIIGKSYRLSKKIKNYINEYGVITTLFFTKNKLKKSKDDFDVFIEKTEKNIMKTEPLEYKPLLSFVIPVYNVLDNQLRECIDSVLNQTYDNYELILVDDKSTWESVPKVLEEYKDNAKITIIYRKENGHISRCTNTGIQAAKGEYIVFMDCDDTVAPNAVFEITKLLNKDKTLDFIYSDEDKLTDDGKKRHFPHFKSDWAPDTFMSNMYTNHLGVYRRSIINEIGGLRVGYEGSQDYDFTLRFTEKTNKVGHIPKILYHWRERPESVAVNMESKPYVLEVVKKLKIDALKRRGLEGTVTLIPEIYQFRVTYKPKGNPLVSIIIPSKDNYEIFQRCILSVIDKTKYKNYEIIVIDNGSNNENKEKYSSFCKKNNIVYNYKKMAFNFSKMCNIGADLSKGQYLLFLNDDTEVTEGYWLENMLGQACLEHSGAVGAKLLYPKDNLIQHCGVIKLNTGPCHAFNMMPDNFVYYFCRNRLEYNYIAVTAACLCVNKKKFNDVGKFDEKLEIAYNDIDLCLKLYEKGFYNVIRNDSILCHYESLSRGFEDTPEKIKRLEKEKSRLYSKHPNLKGQDPFYNINLSQTKVDFSINMDGLFMENSIVEKDKNIKNTINQNVNLCIDTISNSNQLEIKGWAFIENSRLNNLNKKYILLIDDNDNAIVITTTTMLRTDVSIAFGKKNGLNLSGFTCCIKSSEIPKGKYKVGVMLVNRITRKKGVAVSDKVVEIK